MDYQLTGQPVLIGGTMGTNSYILTGTQKGMQETFGSTCHGAGRARSRNNSRNKLDYQQVSGSFFLMYPEESYPLLAGRMTIHLRRHQ